MRTRLKPGKKRGNNRGLGPAGNRVLMFCISLSEERLVSGFQSALEEDPMIRFVWSMDSTVWFHWCHRTAGLVSSSGLMLRCPALSIWMLLTWRLNFCQIKEDPHENMDLLVHIECHYGKLSVASVLTKLNNPHGKTTATGANAKAFSLPSVALLSSVWPAGVSLCPAELLISPGKAQDAVSVSSPEITAFITSLPRFIMCSW